MFAHLGTQLKVF